MNQYVDILLMFAKAFAVGGSICLIAQIVINFTKLTSGRILVFFMLAGVALEGLGLYQYLVDFAGAGATVPISGFGYLLARGAMRGAEQGGERGRDRRGDIRVHLRAPLQTPQQKKLNARFFKKTISLPI